GRRHGRGHWPGREVVTLGDQDSGRRQPVVVVERRDDREEAREESGRGEEVRDDVDALAERRDAPPRTVRIAWTADASHRAPARIWATTVLPAAPRSPRGARGPTSGGRKRATRAPDTIMP